MLLEFLLGKLIEQFLLFQSLLHPVRYFGELARCLILMIFLRGTQIQGYQVLRIYRNEQLLP